MTYLNRFIIGKKNPRMKITDDSRAGSPGEKNFDEYMVWHKPGGFNIEILTFEICIDKLQTKPTRKSVALKMGTKARCPILTGKTKGGKEIDLRKLEGGELKKAVDKIAYFTIMDIRGDKNGQYGTPGEKRVEVLRIYEDYYEFPECAGWGSYSGGWGVYPQVHDQGTKNIIQKHTPFGIYQYKHEWWVYTPASFPEASLFEFGCRIYPSGYVQGPVLNLEQTLRLIYWLLGGIHPGED